MGPAVTGAGGGVVLTAGQAAAALAALDTAAEYLEYRASLTCPECAGTPAELCETHAGDLAAASAYRALADTLLADGRTGPPAPREEGQQ